MSSYDVQTTQKTPCLMHKLYTGSLFCDVSLKAYCLDRINLCQFLCECFGGLLATKIIECKMTALLGECSCYLCSETLVAYVTDGVLTRTSQKTYLVMHL